MARNALHYITYCVVIFFILAYIAEAGKDFYKILNVPRSANERQIKKAFHKLSKKYHPDHNPDESAKKKYMEINAAYDALSDKEKRKIYDQYGEEGLNRDAQGGPPGGGGGHPFGGFGGRGGGFQQFHFGGGGSRGGPEDIFSQFFGGGGHRQQQQQQQRPRYPQGPIYDKDPNVLELTQQNWPFAKTETEDDKDQIWLINFYSHDCGGCHEFSASYKQIAKELKGSVKVAAINCAQHEHICKRQQNVDSYPTIKIYPFHQHAHPIKFTGRAEKQAVLDFANEHVPNFIVTLTGDKIESAIQRLPTYLPQVFIVVNPNKNPLLSPTLITLARTMRTKFKFFAILNEPQKPEFQYFVQHFGEKAPNKKLIINQHTDKPQLFIHTPYQILPYVGQLTSKSVSDHLNELSTTFKQKGYYSSEFATFIRQTRLAVRLTSTLYNSMLKTPTAQYQNVFITCPNIVQELVTLPQFNDQKSSNSNNNNNLVELQENNYKSENIIQYLRSLLYKSNNFFVLDVNDNEMITILSKRTNNEIDNEIQNIKKQCNIIKPDQILNTKQNILLGLGLNLKRSKYTLAAISKTDDVSNAIQFTNRLSMFVESNDNGPTGAKNFKKVGHDEL